MQAVEEAVARPHVRHPVHRHVHHHVEEDAEEEVVALEVAVEEVASQAEDVEEVAEVHHHHHHVEAAASQAEEVVVEVEAAVAMLKLQSNLSEEVAAVVMPKLQSQPQLLLQLHLTLLAPSEVVATLQAVEAVAVAMPAHKSHLLVETAMPDANKECSPYVQLSHSLSSNIISVRSPFFNDCALGASTQKSKSRFLHLPSFLLISYLLTILFSHISLFSPTTITTTPNCLYIFVDDHDVGLKRKKYKEF